MSAYYHGTDCVDIKRFKKDTFVINDMVMALWHAQKRKSLIAFIYVLELGESDVAKIPDEAGSFDMKLVRECGFVRRITVTPEIIEQCKSKERNEVLALLNLDEGQ